MDDKKRINIIKLSGLLALLLLIVLINPSFNKGLLEIFGTSNYDIQPLWSLSIEKGKRVEGVTKDLIIIKEEDRITCEGKDGKKLWNYPIDTENVITIVGKENVYLFVKEKDLIISLTLDGKISWEINKNEIIDIRLLRGDWLGLYIKGDNQPLKGNLEFIDTKGNIVGKISIQDSVLLDYDIDPIEERVIVSTMTTSEDGIYSMLSLSNLKGESWWWNKNKEEISFKTFITSNTIYSVQNNKIIAMDYNREIIWSRDIQKEKVGINTEGNYIYAYAYSDYKSTLVNNRVDNTIDFFSLKGEKIYEAEISQQDLNIKELGKYLVAFDKRKIHVFSDKGTQLFNYSPKKDIISVYIVGDQEIAIAFRNEVAGYKLTSFRN